MKFSLKDAVTGKNVPVIADKPQGDDFIELRHGDTDDIIGQISIEPKTRKVVFRPVPGAPMLVIKAMDSDEILSATQLRPNLVEGDHLRNWKIDGGNLVVWHPTTGKTVELPIHKPGPYTPQDDPHEILGQHEMVFAVALGLHLGVNIALIGPTSVGKTTVLRWYAKKLGWNVIIAPISRGTEAAHLVGEYAPTGPALFEWMHGPVTEAAIASGSHPTILVLDELNRIGNLAELSRIYSLLDDTRMLELKERRAKEGIVERIEAKNLFVAATANPSDDEMADYIGVQDMDPALARRFPIQPRIGYPEVNIEAQALMDRVPDISVDAAKKMCEAAKRVREAAEIRHPLAFTDLVVWAQATPYMGYTLAAEAAVISKAHSTSRASIRDLLRLQGGRV